MCFEVSCATGTPIPQTHFFKPNKCQADWQNKQNPKSVFMKIYSLEKGVSTYSLILQQTTPPNLNPFMFVWGRVDLS